ncbi:hypothetical protein LSAT2_010888 [Lamellibrachia satsuma]|nr:hypothetical protein LSAT2_010888 [Lamellibrachia satsuma]
MYSIYYLDVAVDNIGRGMLWCRIYHFGFLVTALEWLTFVCTHQCGSVWRESPVEAPVLVKAVMSHRILSALLIPLPLQYVGVALLAAGRALCMLVELWFVYSHIVCLLNEEVRADVKSTAAISRTNKQVHAND